MKGSKISIVGGGIIGTSIAYYLSKQGADVILIEKGDIASGSSGSCSGAVMMQSKGLGPKFQLALESRKILKKLSDELSEDIEYQEEGGMIVAENDEELNYITTLAKSQKELGLPVEILNSKQFKEKQPALSKHILASTFCPLDGKVNPLKMSFAFSKAAISNGARVLTYTEMKEIKVNNYKVSAIITDRGKINTDILINAAGAWAPQIAKMVNIKIPIFPRRGILIVTEPVAKVVNGSILSAKYLMSKYTGKNSVKQSNKKFQFKGGLALRHTKEGNLIFGSSREFVGFNTETPFYLIDAIIREASRILPGIEDIKVIRTFAGLRPYTPDTMPILGKISNLRGFIMAAGHEGDGVALAPITGKIVADYVIKGKGFKKIEPLTLERFSRDK